MGTHKKTNGFTIIEVLLVIGITALMAVSLLVGTGTAISTQRYRDAVQTLRSVIQTQYSELTSVRNDRTNGWSCDQSSAELSQEGMLVNRGQSGCVLLGRLMTINGNEIKTYTIVGATTTPELPDGTTDITELKDFYQLNDSPTMTNTSQLEWGTKIDWTKTGVDSTSAGTDRTLSILFITAPTSGQIYTFTSDTLVSDPSPATLRQMIAGGDTVPGRAQRVICVDAGGFVASEILSIYLAPKAAASGAVESRTNDLLAGIAAC